MLTALLTNHLGWVGTVAPLINASPKTTASIVVRQNKAKLAEISKFHPYNVLWAQLGDLHGSIGNPPKISTTVVCGTDSQTLNKVLNILTYFIRCGEIRRVSSTHFIEKDAINDILTNGNQDNTVTDECIGLSKIPSIPKSKGLTRTVTCVKNLDSVEQDEDKPKMNDIPNVLAFRDSRFVRQELRIGNFQMDTGIEMNTEDKLNIKGYQVKDTPCTAIKLLVTSPENERYECEAAAEALDYVLKRIEPIPEIQPKCTLGELITANSIGCDRKGKKTKLLWGIEPVKEGISIEDWQKLKKNIKLNADISLTNYKTDSDLRNRKDARNSSLKHETNCGSESFKDSDSHCTSNKAIAYKCDTMISSSESPALKINASLSDLITANSVGVSDRLQWGIEPVKELVCLEEEIYFEAAQKRIDKEHDLKQSSVVFVLGENEILSGLKTPSPEHLSNRPDRESTLKLPTASKDPLSVQLTDFNPPNPSNAKESPSPSPSTCAAEETTKKANNQTSQPSVSTSSAAASSNVGNHSEKKKKTCNHKKHSGVKFNFEQYPQIVTNYMKNKNLDITSYDFLEKGLKLEQENAFNYGASSTSVLSTVAIEEEQEEEEECECCANASRILQTPSNATELEFSNDDSVYPTFPIQTTRTVQKPAATTKSHENTELIESKTVTENRSQSILKIEKTTKENQKAGTEQESQCHEVESKQKEINAKPALQLIKLPIPKSITKHDSKKQQKIRCGFVPSLFVGITDHYISDMILQVKF